MRVRLVLALAGSVFAGVSPAEGRQQLGWRLVEELRIGGAEVDSGPASFSNVRNLTVDAAGRIYVLDNQPRDLRVFAADGAFLRRIGRLGAGPGEYRGAFGLAWDSLGRLLVVDHELNRYSYFDTAGTFVTSTQRPPNLPYGYRWDGSVLRDGRVVEMAGYRDQTNSYRMVLAILAGDGRLRDTLRLPSPPEGTSYRIQRGDGYMVVPVPFMPRLLWRLDPRGFVWFGTGERYRITQLGLNGDTVRTIERRVNRVPVTSTEIDSALDGLIRVTQAATLDRSRVPGTKPAFTDLVPDDRGFLWVIVPQRRGEAGTAFDVLDPEGRYLGQVRTPLRLQRPLLIRGTRLYGVALDEDDVPAVVRLRIEGRP